MVAPSVAVPTMSNWRFKSAVVALSKPDGHPPVVHVVGSKFTSVQNRGTRCCGVGLQGSGRFKSSELFVRKCGRFCYWGNPLGCNVVLHSMKSGGRRRSDSPAPTSLFVADNRGIIDNYLSALRVEGESHLVNPG